MNTAAASPSNEPPMIDIAALEGDEHLLVRSAFEHHTGAANAVLEDLSTLDIDVPRARLITLSSLLAIAGIHAQEMGVGDNAFAALARHAHEVAGTAVAVGLDMMGEVQ